VLVEGEGAVGGVSQRGAPRDARNRSVDPLIMVDRVNAVVLAGGGVYGSTPRGVVRFLENGASVGTWCRRRGADRASGHLFDLGFGGDQIVRCGLWLRPRRGGERRGGGSNVGAGAGRPWKPAGAGDEGRTARPAPSCRTASSSGPLPP
jgi:hypothetical protein